MKKMNIYLLICILILSLVSCRKSDGKPTSTAIGSSDVDLNAKEDIVRKKEALLGNVVSDALKLYYENKGEVFDFALTIGGSIRYDAQLRPDGIYPKGTITVEMIDEMLPFGNSSAIVTVTGTQLKEMLERSVAQYPLAKGPFLQCSKEIKYKIDTLQSPQVINIDETQIVSPGSRIDSIYINGISYQASAEYRVLVSDYIAKGNDGYVTLKNLPSSSKKMFSDNQANAVKDYFLIESPIKPVFEGRIYFK